MWHTHILSSISKYHEDCVRLIGTTLEHDDSLNDRVEGGMLDVNFKATSKLWREIYGEDYNVVGGMYRGEPPEGYFSTDWVKCVNDQDLLPGLSFAHLVGIAGASSVAKLSEEEKNLVWTSIDAADMFIPKEDGYNPKKENYVFGEGSKF